MTIFFEASKRKPYRDVVQRFMHVLVICKSTPSTKFALICALQTNNSVMDRLLRIAYENNVLTYDDRLICITEKGRKLLEVWQS